MQIRDAVESDLNSLAELLLLVHALHVRAQPLIYREISHDVALEFLAPRLAEPNAYLRVVEAGSALAAYGSATIRTAPDLALFHPRQSVYVNEVVVHPQHRRSGVGRTLIADLKQWAHQHGIDEIELDVGHFNTPARTFFQSQGFEVVRQRLAARFDTP